METHRAGNSRFCRGHSRHTAQATPVSAEAESVKNFVLMSALEKLNHVFRNLTIQTPSYCKYLEHVNKYQSKTPFRYGIPLILLNKTGCQHFLGQFSKQVEKLTFLII